MNIALDNEGHINCNPLALKIERIGALISIGSLRLCANLLSAKNDLIYSSRASHGDTL